MTSAYSIFERYFVRMLERRLLIDCYRIQNMYHNLEPNRLYTCTASIGLVAATKGEHLASRAAAFLRGHFPKIKESSKMHVFNSGILLVSCSCPQQHDGRGEGGGV